MTVNAFVANAARRMDAFVSGPAIAGDRVVAPGHWYAAVLVLLAGAEIVSAVWLAAINPAHGYDEAWYQLNAYRMSGVEGLPFALHRPPMLPILLSLMGEMGWLIPALSHMTATALMYLMLRRVVDPVLTLAGVLAFMLSGPLRVYNVFLLTEMPCIAMMLGVMYLFVTRRALLAGAMSALLLMTHWSMIVIPPVVIGAYAIGRHWRQLSWFLLGFGVISAEFFAAFAFYYGHPLAPMLANARIQQNGVNDVWYYVRHFPQVPVALLAGVPLTLALLIKPRRCVRSCRFEPASAAVGNDRCADERTALIRGIGLVSLGIVVLRVIMLHGVVPKSDRFLVPLIPLLLLLTLVTVGQFLRRWAVWRVACAAMVLLSIMPDRSYYYYLHDLRNDPMHAVRGLTPAGTMGGSRDPIYSDINDLAVMAATARPAVAVVGEKSWHHALLARPRCARSEIPDGASYLTWDPGGSDILASAHAGRRGTLYLVRWNSRAEPVAATR